MLETSYNVEIRADDPPGDYRITHGAFWSEALKGDTVPISIIAGVINELKDQGINVTFIEITDIDGRSHSKVP